MKKENVVIILVEPASPGNIGSTLRAMKNMGFIQLRLVKPIPWRDHALYYHEAERMAWGAADLLDRIEHYDTLAEAVADVHFVYGTSAGAGRYRDSELLPTVAEELVTYIETNRVAFVFGPESRGLSTREMSQVQKLLRIPTGPEYPTLNLSQAVLITCYQLHLAAEQITGSNLDWAVQNEIQALYQHLQQILYEIGFLKHQNPEHAMEIIKTILGRSGLTSGEVRTLRGVVHQISWIAHRYQPPLGTE